MAVVHALAQTVLAGIEAGDPTAGSVLDPIALALLVGVAGALGGVDGWLRTPNRGLTWFFAGLIAGPVAGLLTVLGKAIFVDATGVWALGEALTGGAAFIALLVMVPAAVGMGVGGRLQPPQRKPTSRHGFTPSPVPRV
jgi:hypothetical protein